MLNQVNISGRMARDPELRTAGQSTVANFTLGVTQKFKDNMTGEQKEKTAWVRCTAWGVTAEIVGDAAKGDELVVTGSLETRQWEDKEGVKREVTEVRAFAVYRVAKRGENNAKQAKPAAKKAAKGEFDDEIPF